MGEIYNQSKNRRALLISSLVIITLSIFAIVFLKFGIGRSKASNIQTVSVTDSGIEYTLKQSSEWKESNKFCYVYELIVKNVSDTTIKDWSVNLDLGKDFKLDQSWCGNFSKNDTTISIKPVSYNNNLSKNSSANLGFIIKSDAKLDIENIKINNNPSVTPATNAPVTETPATKAPTNSPVVTSEPTIKPTDKPVVTKTPATNAPATASPVVTSGGFKVSGSKLLDANGNQFIMRGINHAHTWYKDQANTAIKAIAATGANAVRVVLSDGGQWSKIDASELKNIIDLCKSNKLVAVLEIHDATGSNNSSDLDAAADYWIEMKDVLKGTESYVIINIANEWYGDWSDTSWADGYKKVIPKLRNAGITHTLMVDSAGWGQYPTSIINCGKEVFEADTLKNTMFSIHMYEYAGPDSSTVKTNIDGVINQNLCLCIGEFGQKHTNGDVDEDYIMQYCNSKSVGYLGWSWKGNSGGVEFLDIANSWDGSSLSSDWGEKLINGTYGIKKTSKICSIY